MAILSKTSDLLTSHWRGELPLLRAILVPLIAVHLVLSVVLYLGADGIPALRYSLLGLAASVLIWQLVGTLRSTDRAIISHVEMVGAGLSYMAIILVFLSTVAQSVGLMLPNWVPDLQEEPSPPYLRMSSDQTQLFLDGHVTLDHFGELEFLLQKGAGPLQSVVLNSPGGNVHAARGLARLIETENLNTHVAGECLSACTLILMAGATRTAEPNASIGFHQYTVGTYKNLGEFVLFDAEAEQQKDLTYFKRRGLTAGFLEQVFQADAQNLWRPDRETMRRAGVLTE